MNDNLVAYYKARANEYERIYARPERQASLEKASALLQDLFSGKDVFEIACGTGYWTQHIVETAASIVATDINPEVIDIARKKEYKGQVPVFQVQDLFSLKPGHRYSSLFGGFIWSHIKLEQLPVFLKKVESVLAPGALVCFMDNNYVEGSNHRITRTDGHGNTFQSRKLDNGTQHEVLKNFPSCNDLEKAILPFGSGFQYTDLKYYWMVTYTTGRQ